MIEQESPAWGKTLREKMITFDRIFSWPEQVIVEIFKNLQPKTMAFAIHGLKEDQKAKVMQYFSLSEKRRLNDMLGESNPKPEEIASTLVKVIEQTRKMLKNRELHPDKFDDKLHISEDIESRLEDAASHHQFSAMSSTKAEEKKPQALSVVPATSFASAPPTSADVQAGADVTLLQKKVAQLMKENKTLKDDLTSANEKLDQIRRMSKIA